MGVRRKSGRCAVRAGGPSRDPICQAAFQRSSGAAGQEIESGQVKLDYAAGAVGYLPALLKQLDVPVDSQVLVFSKGSIQAEHISPRTPRAIYFNDDVAVGYVQNGDALELTGLDPVRRRVSLHAGYAEGGQGRIRPPLRLPALPRRAADAGGSGADGELGASAHGRPRGPRKLVHHGRSRPNRGTLGRLVRHRHDRRADAITATTLRWSIRCIPAMLSPKRRPRIRPAWRGSSIPRAILRPPAISSRC